MLKSLLQGVVFMATASTLQAAPIDLIIDTDPGADDVVALFLACLLYTSPSPRD